MEPYNDLGGDSGVTGYEIGADRIRVEFRGRAVYRYTYAKPGELHVEQMKELALAGEGLNTYINKYVRDQYEEQEV